MNYDQALEKAVLEHSAEVRRNPRLKTNGHTRIPGFMDGHVWGKAIDLSERGYLALASREDDGRVVVAEISDDGAGRLAQILEDEERLAEEKKARLAASTPTKKKRWWRR